jgi:hypothetical protein
MAVVRGQSGTLLVSQRSGEPDVVVVPESHLIERGANLVVRGVETTLFSGNVPG